MVNERLVSIQRLRNMVRDDDRALVEAVVGWLGHRRRRSRLEVRSKPSPGEAQPQLFFRNSKLPVDDPDPAFLAQTFLTEVRALRQVPSPGHAAPDQSRLSPPPIARHQRASGSDPGPAHDRRPLGQRPGARAADGVREAQRPGGGRRAQRRPASSRRSRSVTNSASQPRRSLGRPARTRKPSRPRRLAADLRRLPRGPPLARRPAARGSE